MMIEIMKRTFAAATIASGLAGCASMPKMTDIKKSDCIEGKETQAKALGNFASITHVNTEFSHACRDHQLATIAMSSQDPLVMAVGLDMARKESPAFDAAARKALAGQGPKPVSANTQCKMKLDEKTQTVAFELCN